jgi:nucleotide-binding universal stress UspA family protein
MPIRSILVADDMLEASRAALDEAVDLAKLTGAKLTVVTVISVVSPGFGIPVPIGDSFDALLEAAKKRLVAQKERLLSSGVREVETALLEGDPVEEVVQYAAKHLPDLIVVGSRGLSTAGRFLLGSVSDGIVHHVHCSVLIVKSPVATNPAA